MNRPDDLATEFDMLMARAGLTVPLDQRTELLAGYAGLLEQVALLRGPRTAVVEPSNVFRLPKLAAV